MEMLINKTKVYTPWGVSQSVELYSNGVKKIHTAGHGGYWVPRKLIKTLPPCFQKEDNYYEEDCEAYIVEFFLAPKGYNHISIKAGLIRNYGKECAELGII